MGLLGLGLDPPDESPPVPLLLSLLVNLAMRLGALAFFFGFVCSGTLVINGRTTGSGGGGTLFKKSSRLSSFGGGGLRRCCCCRGVGSSSSSSSISSSSLRSMA